jgi:hypothetical protein
VDSGRARRACAVMHQRAETSLFARGRNKAMRERNREISRRRQRYAKRKKLHKKLTDTTTDQQRHEIEAKIRKTYPRHVEGSPR